MTVRSVTFVALASAALAADAPDFTREVRPILSRYCFKCHGPDDKAREAELRFDVRDAALRPAESGARAIVPGKPESSELVARIFHADDDERMPPRSTKQSLTPEQKDVLKRWIAAGAEYREHWSFVAPRRPAVPEIRKPEIRNPIDAFIAEKLATAGLAISPEADAATLCRRLYLDLIGLPPTPEELDAFVNSAISNRQSAISNLADDLLARPQYGERWARRWLDLARYADTNGYEKDRERSVWPWRDWVVRALNADMPFDQFTIEQLAGDMLPGATTDQRVATGFHRHTMLNEEGGIDPLEFRFAATVDRVATTGATWLGLTLGCAQCHTHKFDPIQHREYFQVMAFLNNADEPDLELPPPGAVEQRNKDAARAAKLIAGLPEKFPVSETAEPTPPPRVFAERAFEAWIARERERAFAWTPLVPAEAKSNLPLLTIERDASVFASGDISKSDTYEIVFRLERGTPWPRESDTEKHAAAERRAPIRSLRLEVIADERLPAHGPGMGFYEGPKGDFFLGEFVASADGNPLKFARASHSYAKNNFGGNPAGAPLAIDGDAQTGWSCAGRIGESHEAVFVLPAPLAATRELRIKMIFGRHYASSLGRFRISASSEAAEARDLPDDIARLLGAPKLDDAQLAKLRGHFLLNSPELEAHIEEIDRLLSPEPGPTTLVMRERPPHNPRATHIHHRGEFLQPGERVEAGVPAVLNPLPAGPRDRLAFARWLVSRENPLTARVAVNRAWAAFFGRGLVKTTEDFGLQGETPTHPALLDWLAVEFMENGWSTKKLHRLIVTSATYRQSSVLSAQSSVLSNQSSVLSNQSPAKLSTEHSPLSTIHQRDPDNRLLSRFPRTRLDAEIVRDAALRASGLLSLKMGGPGVRPPQPEGVTEVAYGSPKWKASSGEDRHRRSLYTFAKRTAPFALYNTFDAPTGEACVPRRDVSNTPLQALSLLNDRVFIEAAQALGKLLAALPGGDDARVREAFRRLLARDPAPDEVAVLTKFVATQKERFISKELDAVKTTGDAKDASPERAAWTTLVRALLNVDEFVTKG